MTTHDQALSGPGPEKGPEKGHEKGHDRKSVEIEQRMEQICLLLKSDPKMSISGISTELGITHKQVRIAIDRLKTTGVIQFAGSGRGGHWIVRNWCDERSLIVTALRSMKTVGKTSATEFFLSKEE